jgi:hypothetical protein
MLPRSFQKRKNIGAILRSRWSGQEKSPAGLSIGRVGKEFLLLQEKFRDGKKVWLRHLKFSLDQFKKVSLFGRSIVSYYLRTEISKILYSAFSATK